GGVVPGAARRDAGAEAGGDVAPGPRTRVPPVGADRLSRSGRRREREPGQAVARGRRAAEAPPGDRPEGGAALGVVALRLAARRRQAPGDRAEADARVVLGLGRLAHHAVAHHAGLTPGPRRSVLRQRTRTEVKVHDEA